MSNTMLAPMVLAALVGGGFGFGSGSIVGSRGQDPVYWERLELSLDKLSQRLEMLATVADAQHDSFESRLDSLERCRARLEAKGALGPDV